jgi:hypothetical protein
MRRVILQVRALGEEASTRLNTDLVQITMLFVAVHESLSWALFGRAGAVLRCLLIGVDRKWLAHSQNDANDPKQTLSEQTFFGSYCFGGLCVFQSAINFQWPTTKWVRDVVKWGAIRHCADDQEIRSQGGPFIDSAAGGAKFNCIDVGPIGRGGSNRRGIRMQSACYNAVQAASPSIRRDLG